MNGKTPLMPRVAAPRAGLLVLGLLLLIGCARSPEAQKARYLERGDQYAATEQYREAIIEYANVLRFDRDNARATYHLALVQEREGEVRPAADGYARALALSPFDAEVATHLGEAKRKVAVQLGMAGRTAEARDEMRQAVTLLPDNGEAWLDLCLLSLDLGDRTAAATALDRARANGASAERVAFAAAALAR